MNWNEEKTRDIRELWEQGLGLEEVADRMGVNVVSARNKLVRERLYKAPAKKAVINKKSLVRDIEGELGFECPTLVNVNKDELKRLRDWLLDED